MNTQSKEDLQPSQEQIIYANLLVIGVWAGIFILVATYVIYVTGMLPALSWPDIMVGPGLLGGSMILCLEQLLIDVEVFRMLTRARQGIAVEDENWLEDVISQVGPGGHFQLEPVLAAGRHQHHFIDTGLLR